MLYYITVGDFFELISILIHTGYIQVRLGRKSKSARKSVFPVEFQKMVWCNRFLRAWTIQPQRAHNSKKNENFFYDPFHHIDVGDG